MKSPFSKGFLRTKKSPDEERNPCVGQESDSKPSAERLPQESGSAFQIMVERVDIIPNRKIADIPFRCCRCDMSVGKTDIATVDVAC